MGLFHDTKSASGAAYGWVRQWAEDHGADLVTDDEAAEAAFVEVLEQYASGSEDGDLQFDEPGDYPSLPNGLPDEAELILFSAYRWWAFALAHSGAFWMGFTSELPGSEDRVFPLEPGQLLRLLAAGR